MNGRELDRFIGIPYDLENFDCADFVMMVRKELFGIEIKAPTFRPRGKQGEKSLQGLSECYGVKTNNPSNGDLVLMRSRLSNSWHIGLYFFIDEPLVLHSNESNGCSVVHPINNLKLFRINIEGYYKWI